MAAHVELRASTPNQDPVVDANGLKVKLTDSVSGNAVSFGFTPVEITTKTTTLVKSGPGMIGDITINKAGSTDTITVYDALTATGTPIATITAPTLGQHYCELYKFTVGLCIVTGGTTAGNYGVSYQ
jgi:hypothetical protein